MRVRAPFLLWALAACATATDDTGSCPSRAPRVVAEGELDVFAPIAQEVVVWLRLEAPCDREAQLRAAETAPPFWTTADPPVTVMPGGVYRFSWGMDGAEPGTYTSDLVPDVDHEPVTLSVRIDVEE